MLYSAVSQPLPVPTKNGGTVSSMEQVHRTRVRPILTKTLPGAMPVKPRWKPKGRSASAARPSLRMSGPLFEQPGQQPLLGVHAVGRLLEDDAAVAVEHLGLDLLAAHRRQAVHDAGVRRRQRQQRLIDLEAGEAAAALLALGLLAHARPDVGVNDVGLLDGVARLAVDDQVAAGGELAVLLDERLVEAVA